MYPKSLEELSDQSMVFHSIMTLFNFPLNSALTPVCHHHASPRAHRDRLGPQLHASTLQGLSSYPPATASISQRHSFAA